MLKKLSIFILVTLLLLAVRGNVTATEVTVNSDGVLVVDGQPVFPIGFSKAPPRDGKTPYGEDAYAELKTNGTVFHRVGPPSRQWGPVAEAELDDTLDRSAEARLLGAIFIPDLTAIQSGDAAKEEELRRVITKYANHQALGWWKGQDEPEWGRVPVPWVQKFYDIVHELDQDHPVWITQAPRGTIESLRQYDPTYDIGAFDIYPVSYPPGIHGHLPNRNISVVGDYANLMQAVTGGKKPFWMVLQICWSGVSKPGKTLRFPTFPEERYMTYQAIINGARGLVYFGGNIDACLNDRDRELGWNWTFYYKVLKPVLDELNPDSPLYPALIVPNSPLPIAIEGADDIEFTVREAGDQIFILAAKREGSTVQVRFHGLPMGSGSGDVLFEEPRKVTVSGGSFTDWFGPNEVHAYKVNK